MSFRDGREAVLSIVGGRCGVGAKELAVVSGSEKGSLEIQGDMALGADRQIFAGHAKNETTIQKRQVEE